MSRAGAKRGKRLPGAEFSWESEPGGKSDTAPTPLFPKYHVPNAKQLSEEERKQVDYYRRLREKIHDGPYYAVLEGPPSHGKGDAPARARFDPFEGMATYGHRYLKKKRALPKLSARPYIMNFFPKPLWSTLDPNYVGLPGAGGAKGASTLLKGGQKRGFEDEEEEDMEEEEDGRKRKRRTEDDGEGSESGARRDRTDEALLDEDEEEEEEIIDDDFEDDEDDMGGDYNAEQYFDGGDDDGDGFDGDGAGDDTY